MRTLIPQILDVNVLSWEDHVPNSWVALDKEIKYEDNEFSIVGIKNMVKIWLKIDRRKLKIRFLERKIDCPINIELAQWEKLKVY